MPLVPRQGPFFLLQPQRSPAQRVHTSKELLGLFLRDLERCPHASAQPFTGGSPQLLHSALSVWVRVWVWPAHASWAVAFLLAELATELLGGEKDAYGYGWPSFLPFRASRQ